MKSLLAAVLGMSICISAFAEVIKIGEIKERDSIRSIVYTQDAGEIIFILKDGSLQRELKRLKFSRNSKNLTLEGDRDPYNFRIFKTLKYASAKSYDWCWHFRTADRNDNVVTTPALSGLVLAGVGAVGTASLCATVPGVPFILGVLLAPVDALITLGDHIWDADQIAVRKFQKLLSGKDRKASRKVFDSLIQQIEEL